MKTKDSMETVRAFLTMITKKNGPKKFGLTGEQILLESFKNFATLKEYKICSTMSETKAASAERTI